MVAKNLGFLELFYWKNEVYGSVLAAFQWGFTAEQAPMRRLQICQGRHLE